MSPFGLDVFRIDLPLVLVLVPGFVAMKVYDLLVPSERRNWTDSVLEVFAYGTIQFALTYWALDWFAGVVGGRPWLTRAAMTTYLLVVPSILGIGAYGILRWERMRRWVRHPARSGWDYFFGQRKKCWVLCHLKGGEVLGGKFGDRSLATTYPDRMDIYIEEVWRISPEGKLTERVERTAGAYIRMDDCRMIEFFDTG
jgi:hypothetical protein